MVTSTVEHAHGANRRALDDGEAQAGATREGPVDADGDDAAGAEIGLVQSEASAGAKRAGVATILFADEPSLAVAVLPGGELFGMPFRRPRRAVGPGDHGAGRRGF
ncbi:hypothetical protein A9K68_030180 [Mesorhizobium sp. AA22]|nr:hypothetical protein A9K68_030180 [Mesorhizobium sp. AA22]